jgi:hypothetical protein
MKKVFENPNTEIFNISDEIPSTVFAYWKGFLDLNDTAAVEACEVSLVYFKENGIKVMISDHSKLEGASVPFLDWIHDYYFPTSVKNGLKAEIILDSQYDMGCISLDLMYDEEDMYQKISKGELFTPKADSLENAKKLALQLITEMK